MLVLKRKAGESVVIMPNIKITILTAEDGRVKIGIEAPDDVKIIREEIISDQMKGEFNALSQAASPVS